MHGEGEAAAFGAEAEALALPRTGSAALLRHWRHEVAPGHDDLAWPPAPPRAPRPRPHHAAFLAGLEELSTVARPRRDRGSVVTRRPHAATFLSGPADLSKLATLQLGGVAGGGDAASSSVGPRRLRLARHGGAGVAATSFTVVADEDEDGPGAGGGSGPNAGGPEAAAAITKATQAAKEEAFAEAAASEPGGEDAAVKAQAAASALEEGAEPPQQWNFTEGLPKVTETQKSPDFTSPDIADAPGPPTAYFKPTLACKCKQWGPANAHPTIAFGKDFLAMHPDFKDTLTRLKVHMEDTTLTPHVVHWDAAYDLKSFQSRDPSKDFGVSLRESHPAMPRSGTQLRFLTFCPRDARPHDYELRVTGLDAEGNEIPYLVNSTARYEAVPQLGPTSL